MASTIFGTYSQNQVVTLNGKQTIPGQKTFLNAVFQDAIVNRLQIGEDLVFPDGTSQTTSYQTLVPGTYVNTSIVVNSLGQIIELYNGSGGGSGSNAVTANVEEADEDDLDYYPILVKNTANNQIIYADKVTTPFTYNPAQGQLSTAKFVATTSMTAPSFVGTASDADQIKIIADETSAAEHYVPFVETSAGTYKSIKRDSSIQYNPNLNTLTVPTVKTETISSTTSLTVSSPSVSFTNVPTCTTAATSANELTNKTAVDGLITTAAANYVQLTGAQSIAGVKTFTSVPVCTTAPSAGSDLVNKTYADTNPNYATLAGSNTFTAINNTFSNNLFVPGIISSTTAPSTPLQLTVPADPRKGQFIKLSALAADFNDTTQAGDALFRTGISKTETQACNYTVTSDTPLGLRLATTLGTSGTAVLTAGTTKITLNSASANSYQVTNGTLTTALSATTYGVSKAATKSLAFYPDAGTGNITAITVAGDNLIYGGGTSELVESNLVVSPWTSYAGGGGLRLASAASGAGYTSVLSAGTKKLSISGTSDYIDAACQALTVTNPTSSPLTSMFVGYGKGAEGWRHMFIGTGLGPWMADTVTQNTGTNMAIGHQAGQALGPFINNIGIGSFSLGGATNPCGSNNICIGVSTGVAFDGNSGNASRNTLIGTNTGFKSTTANENTGVGDQVFINVTTSLQNTSIGAYAGNRLVSGTGRNIFIGFNAGALTTNVSPLTQMVGDNNVCIGTFSGARLAAGTQNILIGGNAGANMSGNSNAVMIGYNAGTGCTATGVIIGGGAGVASNASVDNTIIGIQSGAAATSSGHTLVGYQSGQALTLAINNTILGAYAGKAITGVTTNSNNNTLLGWSAAGATTTSFRNVIVGSNCCANPTLMGKNNIIMGTSTFGTATAVNFAGTGNIIMGALLGAATTLTTASDNIILCPNSTDAEINLGITTETNEVRLGTPGAAKFRLQGSLNHRRIALSAATTITLTSNLGTYYSLNTATTYNITLPDPTNAATISGLDGAEFVFRRTAGLTTTSIGFTTTAGTNPALQFYTANSNTASGLSMASGIYTVRMIYDGVIQKYIVVTYV